MTLWRISHSGAGSFEPILAPTKSTALGTSATKLAYVMIS